jgi:hypothetical protein
MREYLGSSGGCCDLGMKCCELCDCCSGLCDSCYYHGTHNFDYEDSNSTEVKNAFTVKTVGHDDMAWYAEATYILPLPLLSYIPLHYRHATVDSLCLDEFNPYIPSMHVTAYMLALFCALARSA